MAEDTKERILDAAEQFFAERGFAATSLRAITSGAGVNLAAVHYHFGSKEALFEAVFARRITPVNDERLRRLDALEAAAGQPPALEAVVEAFLAPALQLGRDPRGSSFLRLAGRAYTEPGSHWAGVAGQFEEIKQRYLGALRATLPEVPAIELFWRVNFMVGVMCHTMSDSFRLEFLSDGACDQADIDVMLAQMVPFVCGGFRAPVPGRVESGS